MPEDQNEIQHSAKDWLKSTAAVDNNLSSSASGPSVQTLTCGNAVAEMRSNRKSQRRNTCRGQSQSYLYEEETAVQEDWEEAAKLYGKG